MTLHRSPIFKSQVWLCGAAMLACAALFLNPFAVHAQSSMQGVPNAMQGFSQNRDKPVQIEALSLEVREKDKAATFSGDVKVVQGDTTMRSKTLVVFYDQTTPGSKQPAKQPAMKSAAPGPTGSSQIRRLEARGGVTVTQKDQVVTGESGVFDMKTNSVTMSGGVVLTKGKNVLRGDRLVVDMTSGVSRVEVDKGKVTGLFQTDGGGPTGPAGILPAPNSAPAAAPSTPSRTPRSSEPLPLSPPR